MKKFTKFLCRLLDIIFDKVHFIWDGIGLILAGVTCLVGISYCLGAPFLYFGIDITNKEFPYFFKCCGMGYLLIVGLIGAGIICAIGWSLIKAIQNAIKETWDQS